MLQYVRITGKQALPDIRGLRPYKAVVVVEEVVPPERQKAVSRWLVDTGCLYMMAWGPMFELARGYKRLGMTAYPALQDAEFAAEANGYTAVRHQREVGTSYFDAVANVLSHRQSSTTAMQGSTEEGQFRTGTDCEGRVPQRAPCPTETLEHAHAREDVLRASAAPRPGPTAPRQRALHPERADEQRQPGEHHDADRETPPRLAHAFAHGLTQSQILVVPGEAMPVLEVANNE